MLRPLRRSHQVQGQAHGVGAQGVPQRQAPVRDLRQGIRLQVRAQEAPQHAHRREDLRLVRLMVSRDDRKSQVRQCLGFEQLIFGPRWPMNKLNRNPKNAQLETSYQLLILGTDDGFSVPH